MIEIKIYVYGLDSNDFCLYLKKKSIIYSTLRSRLLIAL